MGKNSVRCFLGVGLDETTLKRIEMALRPLQSAPWARRVRWVLPHNWHMTLAFLGDQSLDWLDGLRAPLDASLLELKLQPFDVRGQWITGFPDAKSRIVALTFQASPALLTLKSTLDSVLLQQAFTLEKRRFRPHVTLGRVKRDQQVHFDPAICEVLLPVTALTLYQSILTAQGSEYHPLWSVALPRL